MEPPEQPIVQYNVDVSKNVLEIIAKQVNDEMACQTTIFDVKTDPDNREEYFLMWPYAECPETGRVINKRGKCMNDLIMSRFADYCQG